MKYDVELGERAASVDVRRGEGGWWVSVDGGAERFVQGGTIAPATWRLAVGDDLPKTVGVALNGEQAFVLHDHEPYQGKVVDPRDHALDFAGGAAQGQVTTQMPGSVVRVLVSEGDAVAEGQVLLVVEAMKMENEFKAPFAATVSSVAVEAGQTVDAGGPAGRTRARVATPPCDRIDLRDSFTPHRGLSTMPSLGFGEMLLVGAVILLFVGPERLPYVTRQLGRWYGKFRRAADELRRALVIEADRLDEEERLKALQKRRQEAELERQRLEAESEGGPRSQPDPVSAAAAEDPPAPPAQDPFLPPGFTAEEFAELPEHIQERFGQRPQPE